MEEVETGSFGILKKKITSLYEDFYKLEEIVDELGDNTLQDFLNTQLRQIAENVNRRKLELSDPPNEKQFAERLFKSAMEIKTLSMFSSQVYTLLKTAVDNEQSTVQKYFQGEYLNIKLK